jgi:hypothetical protein
MISARKGFLLYFVLSLLIAGGCSTENHKIRKKEIIPEKDLIPILVDMHMANAMFSLSSLRVEYPGTDSLSNYRDILSQYGYQMGDFDNTLIYYEKHMNELEAIYEQVMKRLQDIEREVRGGDLLIGSAPGQHNTNIWTKQTEYHLPREGARNKIPFSVPVYKTGMYILSARIRLFRDDQSEDPTIHAYFWYDDGTTEGKQIPIKDQPLPKDNQIHQYTLSGTCNDSSITHLKGFLLDDKNKDTLYMKHADVLDIRVVFKPRQSTPK